MTTGPCNLVVYLGTGEKGQKVRQNLEQGARLNGFVKKGRVTLAPYILAVLEGRLPPIAISPRQKPRLNNP